MSRKKNICTRHIFCGKTKVITIRQGMEYRQVWPDFKGQHSFFPGCVKRGTLELIGKTFGEIPSASPSDLPPPPPPLFPKVKKSFTPTLHLASTCKMFKTTHKDCVAPVFYTVAQVFPFAFRTCGALKNLRRAEQDFRFARGKKGVKAVSGKGDSDFPQSRRQKKIVSVVARRGRRLLGKTGERRGEEKWIFFFLLYLRSLSVFFLFVGKGT